MNKIISKILIVEDNEINQELIFEFLNKAGYTVKQAFDGKEAIKFAENEEFDLIFMDIQMPDIDGFETSKMIHNTQKNKNTPIIALTAYNIDKNDKLFLEAKMYDYIQKPIKFKELLNLIQELNSEILNEEEKKDDNNMDVPLDIKKLKNDMLDSNELLEKSLNIIIKDFPEKITKIKNLVDNNKFELLVIETHKYKGSIGMLNKKLYNLFNEMEKFAKEKNKLEIEKVFKNIIKSMEEVEKYIKEYIKK